MKILYACLKYDYGLKENGLNELALNGFIPAFQRYSDLSCFYYDNYVFDKKTMSKKFNEVINIENPSIIFIDNYLDIFDADFLLELKKKYITVAWFGDDQWRFDSFSSNYANFYTAIVTTDKYSVSKYKKLGQKNVILSQWGVVDAPEVDMANTEYKYDLIFVGRIHPYRKWFVDQLSKLGFHVKVYGPGWENGKLPFNEFRNIGSNAKICLNISNAVSYDIRHLSIKNPRSISTMLRSEKMHNPTNARLMEIPYYGGFQLAEYGSPVEDYFNIGEDIVCYRSINDAEILIRHYLENDIEREKIRLSGYKKSRQRYSYNSIVKKIISDIDGL
jgi:spore maturation protein CgeB